MVVMLLWVGTGEEQGARSEAEGGRAEVGRGQGFNCTGAGGL